MSRLFTTEEFRSVFSSWLDDGSLDAYLSHLAAEYRERAAEFEIPSECYGLPDGDKEAYPLFFHMTQDETTTLVCALVWEDEVSFMVGADSMSPEESGYDLGDLTVGLWAAMNKSLFQAAQAEILGDMR